MALDLESPDLEFRPRGRSQAALPPAETFRVISIQGEFATSEQGEYATYEPEEP
jgi:hypothetical protein